MLAKLKTSLLTERHAKLLRLEPYSEDHDLNLAVHWAGFKIPYFTLDGDIDPAGFYRFRNSQTKPSRGWGATTEEPKKPLRYLQPPDTGCEVYLPPLLEGISWREVAKSAATPLIITEGELKAACGCANGIPTLGLGGVNSWRSAKQKQALLPGLEAFVWHDRDVRLCFDSDLATNVMVRVAAGRLAKALSDRGAIVTLVMLPPGEDGAKQGMDDYAVANGVDALIKVIAEAEPIGPGVHLHELNGEVALVKSTGEVVELSTGTAYSASLFADVIYKHRHYTDFNGKISIEKYTAREWLAWPYRTEVPQVAYAPDEPTLFTGDGSYNSWYSARWGVAPSKVGTVKPWEDFLHRVFDGLDKTTLQWVRQWFAYPLQYPGAKLYTALVVWGPQQGTGKTLLGETMSRIYGQNYGTVNDIQLADKFNEWAERKQFIVGDEIALGDKRHMASMLKDMITRTTLRLNSKNRKTYVITDHVNYYLTSNHEDAVYIENGDRRMFVHRLDAEPLKPNEYQFYLRWLDKEGGAARLFHYLLHEVDLSNFDPHGRAPETAAKVEMMASTRSDVEDWAVQLKADPDTAIPLPRDSTRRFDLFRTTDLLKLYDPDGRERVRSIGMGRALSHAGIFKVADGSNNAVIEGVRTRFWAVRNPDLYRSINPAKARALYLKEREGASQAGSDTPTAPVGASKKFAAKEKTQ